jgi:hypothetical protein
VFSLADSQCEYDSVEMSCTYCRTKGLVCGNKISASGWRSNQLLLKTQLCTVNAAQPGKIALPRQIERCEEEILTPFEERHIHSLHEGKFLFTFALLQLSRTDGGRLEGALYRRFGPYVSSKPVRYGCILYSIFKAGDAADTNSYHLIYLDHFYRAMRDAIERQEFADVAYGCYTACMYSLKVRRPVAEIARHAEAFRLSVRLLKVSGASVDEETFLLECMWEKLLWHMGRQLFFKSNPTQECLNQLLHFAEPLLLSDYKGYPRWIRDSFSELEVKYQFLRFVMLLDLQCTPTSAELKQLIVKRFVRSWTTTQAPSRDRTTHRSLSRDIWSGLLTLLCYLEGQTSLGISCPPMEIITSIRLAVDRIPKSADSEMISYELWDLIDLGVCSMVLIGLVQNEFQKVDVFGSTWYDTY